MSIIAQKGISKTKESSNHFNGEVNLLKKCVDIDTGICSLLLQIWLSSEKHTEKLLMRSDVYKATDLLYNCGAVIGDTKIFTAYISNAEKQLDISYTHNGIGWSEYEGNRLFKYSNAFPLNSEYVGTLDIKQEGSFEGWKDTVEKYAMSQTALQLGIVLGLSAVTTGFLKDELDGTLLVHLYGASSKGKTTFAMLAVSTAGNPSQNSKNTLMCDWSDTPNYKISVLANNNGFPIVFDELSKTNQKNLSDFCYNVANGRDKGRLNSNAERKDVFTWSTTVISTGESSILAQCNNNSGLLVRVLEIALDSITESAHTAEKLKSGIIKNYGFANVMVAQYLFQNETLIKDKFFEWRKKIERDIEIKSSLVKRLSKKLAVIMLTAEISRTVLGLDFDIEGIEKIIIDSVNKQNERNPFDMGENLIQFLLEDIVIHPENYQEYSLDDYTKSYAHNITAVIKAIHKKRIGETNVAQTEVIYIPRKFEELLLKGGFTDINLCLNELKKRNYLVTDKDHNKIKRTIEGKKIRTYCVRFPTSLITPTF